MTLRERIERKKAELASLKPRSQRRIKVQAELDRLRLRELRIDYIISEIAA